ncbi:MAG: hypothetical protein LC745_12560, partial [Planctomycetia bacterium]|nr:hypothetical protein [Planctomycetia bacterium]
MARRSRRGVRACWLGLALALGVSDRARSAEGTPPEAPEAARWVAADALVYLEVPKPSAVIDRLSDDRLRAALGVIPSVKKAVEGEEFRKLKA